MATSNNPPTPVRADLPSMMAAMDILDPQIQTGDMAAGTSNQDFQNITISTGRVLPGTLHQEALTLRIAEARKTFAKTTSFKHVAKQLGQYGHVTICGASGEGKTTMALMLAKDYIKKGYDAVFVENVDVFDVNEILYSSNKLVLIVDDVFGSVGLTTDISHLQKIINSLKYRIQHLKQEAMTSRLSEEKSDETQKSDKRESKLAEQMGKKDIRVVFTSKTYNFNEGISKMQHQKFSMFKGHTTIDLTANKDYHYSDEEKIAIFEKHKVVNPKVKTDDIPKEDLLRLDTELFGFPLTCRLYFEFASFSRCAIDFFRRPLFYLRIEINNMLSLNNSKTAALILMLLCQDHLHLAKLELPGTDPTVDENVSHVTDILTSVTRQNIVKAVRNFKGTIFSGGDVLTFAHSSIYDACGCAWYEFNPAFVLQYCSLDFLHERLKPGPVMDSRGSDHFHFLFASESYFDLIATRLVEAMKQGQFAKTVTQPLLKNESFAEVLLSRLQSTSTETDDNSWVHLKDRHKGFLYWAVTGHCAELIHNLEDLLNIKLTQSEISEALEGSVEKDKLAEMKFLFSIFETKDDFSFLNKLLLLSGETGSWKMSEYLLKAGADINTSDEKKQNYIHIVCRSVRANILKSFIGCTDALITKKDYISALRSVDFNGRTPAMSAALSKSWDCLNLIIGDSDVDTQDATGNSIIHIASWHGNHDVVQHILTPSNINSRGFFGLTPVMYAAMKGQQRVFSYLVSKNADLTLLDDSGNNSLHLACCGGNRDIVKHLLVPSNINSRGCQGLTPVMAAAVTGQQGIFTYLVSKEADLTLVADNGENILHLACRGGNKDIVQHVLTPSNINSKGWTGLTPVMYAAIKGHQRVFSYLVSKNADLTLLDDSGDNSLHLACRGGNRDIVKHLLMPSNINSRGCQGLTPVMAAAVTGQQGIFTYLVSKEADLTLVADNGENILHLACQGDNKDIMQCVLTPSNINSRGLYGMTPVMVAAVHGQQNAFMYLVSKDADLTLVSHTGDSLLHLACQGGNKNIVQQVLSPSNINRRGRLGWTPVMKAAVNGRESVFSYLVSKNADLTVVSDNGNNVLHLACEGGDIKIVQNVLTSSNINTRGEFDWTPIMNAAFYGHAHVFVYLFKNNADVTLTDEVGDSILHLACQGGNKDIVQFVLTPSNINKRGRHGWTPIMKAAYNGKQSVFDYLVSKSADLTLVDNTGDSLLHLACHGGNVDIVQHVLTPSNINSRGEIQCTPVMKAAVSGQLRVFNYLVSKKANLKLKDGSGDMLLHLACQGGNRDIVKHVLTPSNINSRGRRGLTPVMKAACYGHRKIIDLLIESKADLTLKNEDGLDVVGVALIGGKTDIAKYLQSRL